MKGAACKMRKRLVLAAVFAVMAVAVAPAGTAVAQGQRFSDVPADHYAFAAVEWAAEAGVTLGYGDGTFRPSVALGRWHALTLRCQRMPSLYGLFVQGVNMELTPILTGILYTC